MKEKEDRLAVWDGDPPFERPQREVVKDESDEGIKKALKYHLEWGIEYANRLGWDVSGLEKMLKEITE